MSVFFSSSPYPLSLVFPFAALTMSIVPPSLQLPSFLTSSKKLTFLHQILSLAFQCKTAGSKRSFSSDLPRLFHCLAQSQRQEEYEVERLFSILNQVTFKREPGSLSNAIFLIAGTTVCVRVARIHKTDTMFGYSPHGLFGYSPHGWGHMTGT